MKKLFILGALILFGLSNLMAQKKSFEDILKVEIRNIGEIISGDEVKGYYFFYKVDQVDRKTNLYRLQILDADLNSIAKKSIKDPKHVALLEASFNNEALLFKFYDVKSKEIIYRLYDHTAELVRTKRREQDKISALYYQTTITQMEKDEISNVSIFSVPNKGFVSYEYKKEKKLGYNINFIPSNESQEKWKEASSATSKVPEAASFLAVNNSIVLSTVAVRDKTAPGNFIIYLLGNDIETGKKVFKKELPSSRYATMPMNAFVDKETDEISLFGLYFDKAKGALKVSRGVYSAKISNTGEVSDPVFVSWAKDVNKLLPSNDKGKLDDIGFIYFHKFVQTADGKIVAVGEQYKKAASAMGLVSLATGNQASALEIKVRDMFLFEFSENFELQDVKIFEKGQSTVGLPPGYGMLPPFMMGYYLKTVGGFDYSYTQNHAGDEGYTVTYIDWERRKGEKNRSVLGAVSYVGGEYTKDKLDLSTDASQLRVLPAKPGHVLIFEYFKKQKKMDARLEKINF